MGWIYRDGVSGAHKAERTVRLKMVDGTYRWCRLIGFFVKDANDAPSRTVGVIIDVNDERERSVMLDTLVNDIPGGVGIFMLGKERIECLYYSDDCLKVIGLAREEAKKESARERSSAPWSLRRITGR